MARQAGLRTSYIPKQPPLLPCDAAKLLGLKPGRCAAASAPAAPGHHEGEPIWRGWLTTRAVVENYRSR
jgi:hypothetical protein